MSIEDTRPAASQPAMSRARSSSPRMPLATAGSRPPPPARLDRQTYSPRIARGRCAFRARAPPTARRGCVPLDRADDQGGQRQLAILGDLRARGHARGGQRGRAVDAAHAGRQVSWPVFGSASSSRPKILGTSPGWRREPRARRRREGLVRIVRRASRSRPAPGPEMRQLQLARDLADGQRMPFRDARTTASGASAPRVHPCQGPSGIRS